ncbi:hypothetical protein BA898_06075 [Spiribacter roseus]|nr:hypothetical protein BA898_06075 [Spiribacter roseus]
MPKRREARYSVEYLAEALALAERVGVAAAASKLGLHATQIYQWRAKAGFYPTTAAGKETGSASSTAVDLSA